MKYLTLEENAKRIKNINDAHKETKAYTVRHRIDDYMPGQATYSLGDYPEKFSIEPTEYDYNLLKKLSDSGAQLIQIHEEWNDALRHLGADKFTSHDEKGLHNFVDLCHNFDFKVLPYISTGYFNEYDPDFKEDFAKGPYNLRELYYSFRRCSAGSASWREYLLPRTFAVVDKYGFDGIYNDWGYDGFHLAWENGEYDENGIFDIAYDPEIEDLLSLIYNEVKKRGGIYKLHCGGNNAPNTKDKVYDYLWIGEAVDAKGVGVGKTYAPYIIPCHHMSFSKEGKNTNYFAKTIPFLQFPLLKIGRPMTGGAYSEAVKCPDITMYPHPDGGKWFEQEVYEYMQEHPDGPYVYSLWSSIPDDVTEFDTWSKYLALYKPMVTQSSVCYIEVRESEEILSEIPQDVYASLFVNENMYYVISNLGNEPCEITFKNTWLNRESGEAGKTFTIPGGEMIFLIKQD